jgi:hypothetical protein
VRIFPEKVLFPEGPGIGVELLAWLLKTKKSQYQVDTRTLRGEPKEIRPLLQST